MTQQIFRLREMFYSIAWTTLFVELADPPQMNILAAAGARGTLHLIHPEGGVAFFECQIIRSKTVTVSSLLFHPKQCSILFCALSDGQVMGWDIGSPSPPDYNMKLNCLLTLEARLEIFNLVYSLQGNILMAACSIGVCGWIVTQEALQKKSDSLPILKFQFPRKHIQNTSEPQLVDSLVLLGDGMVGTKCALHGVIYVWDLMATLAANGEEQQLTVTPIRVLTWSNTDNYFMNMGCHPVAGLLVCGDDRGALWLYNLKEAMQVKEQTHEVQPLTILDWPDITDMNLDRNRKLRLDVYDIVVDSVAVSCTGKYLVAVTSNNMVCIWKKMKSWKK
ncbi:leucine-rich repeat and WD repeat-containing protein 1 isoform X2 [Cryptotermes secundus]|nr:leucine-rich repeat and WD repeat-containing protein 1 isoform X2 [Cryptotermes secundus]